MNIFIFLLFASVYSKSSEKYTSKFDSIDFDVAVRNERLVNAHFNCLMNGKHCTPDAELLRRKFFTQLKKFVAKNSLDELK